MEDETKQNNVTAMTSPCVTVERTPKDGVGYGAIKRRRQWRSLAVTPELRIHTKERLRKIWIEESEQKRELSTPGSPKEENYVLDSRGWQMLMEIISSSLQQQQHQEQEREAEEPKASKTRSRKRKASQKKKKNPKEQEASQFVEAYEQQLFDLFGRRASDYLHQLRCFLLCLHGVVRGFLLLIQQCESRLTWFAQLFGGYNWDAHALRLLSADQATKRKACQATVTAETVVDETLLPMDVIYKKLKLDNLVQLVQCKRCKSWKTRFFFVQTRGSDEALTTKCLCTNCPNTWTASS